MQNRRMLVTVFHLSPLACVFILIGITCFVGWFSLKQENNLDLEFASFFGVQGLHGVCHYFPGLFFLLILR